ncbi:DUF2177 family protein [Novosphingobium sp.]|uniref:DUF2177 family protein n=1 Tax=Novosphingobium sp. TaxID=1874826 RepID=UPI0025CCB5CB|nr:DUF2177 family protein [Novosphingobium sp.]
MGPWIIAYIATGVAFLGIDAVWLSFAANKLYRPNIGPLMLDKFSVPPAALFYLIYIGGIVFFAIAPALASGRWTAALVRGALLGFVCYATYDLTNQATLKGWSSTVTVADLCWGTFVTGAAASVGFLVLRWAMARA